MADLGTANRQAQSSGIDHIYSSPGHPSDYNLVKTKYNNTSSGTLKGYYSKAQRLAS